jgi:hypothetical protein
LVTGPVGRKYKSSTSPNCHFLNHLFVSLLYPEQLKNVLVRFLVVKLIYSGLNPKFDIDVISWTISLLLSGAGSSSTRPAWRTERQINSWFRPMPAVVGRRWHPRLLQFSFWWISELWLPDTRATSWQASRTRTAFNSTSRECRCPVFLSAETEGITAEHGTKRNLLLTSQWFEKITRSRPSASSYGYDMDGPVVFVSARILLAATGGRIQWWPPLKPSSSRAWRRGADTSPWYVTVFRSLHTIYYHCTWSVVSHASHFHRYTKQIIKKSHFSYLFIYFDILVLPGLQKQYIYIYQIIYISKSTQLNVLHVSKLFVWVNYVKSWKIWIM